MTGAVAGLSAGQVLKLAIAVNGRIVAVTTSTSTGGKPSFSTFVPDTVFLPGPNVLTIFALRAGDDGQLALAQIGSKGTDSRLSAAGG